jgi:hypothetical protein
MSTNSNTTTDNTIGTPTKGIPRLIVPMTIGVTVMLIALIYNTLFPKAFWQSRELEQNQAKWESQHITHYRMSIILPFSSSNYDRMPLTVEVQDGKVISVVDVHGETVARDDNDIAYYYPDRLTIPGLFSYAYQTFWEKPPTIKVTYEPDLGYPETIYVDPYTEPCCQDFTFEVRDFEVLP